MAGQRSVLQDASWQDRVFIGIKKKGSSNVKYFAGLTNETDLPEISKDYEQNGVMNGGTVRVNQMEEAQEFTVTLYPIGVLTGDGSTRPEGMSEWILTSDDQSASSEGPRYKPSLERYDFGIALLWTNVDDNENSTSPVRADSAIDTSAGGEVKAGLRYVYKNAQVTGYNADFGDEVHTAEVTFKFSPYDETGSENYFHESTQDTSTESLPAVLDTY